MQCTWQLSYIFIVTHIFLKRIMILSWRSTNLTEKSNLLIWCFNHLNQGWCHWQEFPFANNALRPFTYFIWIGMMPFQKILRKGFSSFVYTWHTLILTQIGFTMFILFVHHWGECFWRLALLHLLLFFFSFRDPILFDGSKLMQTSRSNKTFA